MSAYSDWKCGAITDEQYQFLAKRENRRDEWEREHEFDDLADEWEDDDSEGGLISEE